MHDNRSAEDMIRSPWETAGLRVMPRHRYGPCRCEPLDQINIYALHTRKALEEAKSADPKYTLKGSSSIIHYNKNKTSIDMDLSIAVYRLTKDPNEA